MNNKELFVTFALIAIWVLEDPIRLILESTTNDNKSVSSTVKPPRPHEASVTSRPANAIRPIIEGENLVRNPRFEQRLASWKHDEGAFWSADIGSDYSGALVMNTAQITGKPPWRIVSQCIPLGDSVNFDIRAKFRFPSLEPKPQKRNANRLNVFWFDGVDCATGWQFEASLQPSLSADGWQELEKTNIQSALGATAVLLEIIQYQEGNNNTQATWDDLHFAKSTAKPSSESLIESSQKGTQFYREFGENYIENPSFDNNIDSWYGTDKSSIWRTLPDSNGGVIAGFLENKDSGVKWRNLFSQCVNFAEFKRFEVGGKVMESPESTQSGIGRIKLTWHEKFDCQGRYRKKIEGVDTNPDVDGWQNLRLTDPTFVAEARSAQITIAQLIKGRGKHMLYWDDFYFRAIEQ